MTLGVNNEWIGMSYIFKEHEDLRHPFKIKKIYVSYPEDKGWMWKIEVDCNSCINKDGQIEFEPIPSERNENVLNRCRFKTFNEAAAVLLEAFGRLPENDYYKIKRR